MSRTINDSVSLLAESLDSCKEALKNKRVSLPSTVKVSDLPTLINKVKTTFEVRFYGDPNAFTIIDQGVEKTYNYICYVLEEINQNTMGVVKNGGVYKTQAYKHEKDGTHIFIYNVPYGWYRISLQLDNTQIGVVSDSPAVKIVAMEYARIGNESIGLGDSVVTLLIPIEPNVKEVYLNGSSDNITSAWGMKNLKCIQAAAIRDTSFTVEYQDGTRRDYSKKINITSSGLYWLRYNDSVSSLMVLNYSSNYN